MVTKHKIPVDELGGPTKKKGRRCNTGSNHQGCNNNQTKFRWQAAAGGGPCFERTRVHCASKLLGGGMVEEEVMQLGPHLLCLDGAIMISSCKEDQLPVHVPILQDRERAPRVLMKVKNPKQLESLYSEVSGMILDLYPHVESVKCYSAQFCACLPSAKRTSWGHGTEHRDTIATNTGYLTAIVFYDNLPSGGVRLWKESQNFKPGKDFGSNRPKDLKRSLNKFNDLVVQPETCKIIVFDSRLIHQSLSFTGFSESQRLALTFQISIGGVPELVDTTEF